MMPRLLCLLLILLCPVAGITATATVAVSSNFRTTFEQLNLAFKHTHPHQLKLVSAATGVLYQQILQGAPFNILLAADSWHPQLLEQQGKVANNSRFTYATGELVLIGAAQLDGNPEQAIKQLLKIDISKLAIANPDTAPYGLAAQQVLEHLGLWSSLQSKLVRAANIAQAFQYVDSGSANLGLVAWSQAIHRQVPYQKIPDDWYTPIQQQAILLQSGANNPAARDFIRFMKSPTARNIIRKDGYTVMEQD